MVKESSHQDSDGHHTEAQHADHHTRRPIYARGITPLLAFILFAIIFALIFLMNQGAGKTQYDALNQKSLAIREFGATAAPTTLGYFTSYGVLGGIGFGILTLIISYIVYGLARIAKWDGAAGLGVLIAYGLFAFYGFEFAYLGPGTVPWANGITAFIGPPLLWSGIILALAGLASIIMVLRRNSATKGAQ